MTALALPPFARALAGLARLARHARLVPVRARRAGVPTILQMEAVECGAACLGMILARYGRYVPLEEVRAACGVSRDGSKALNIVRAARGYGLEAKAFKREPEELRDIALPAVLHWRLNHFVVLEGVGADVAWLNDPARGRVTVPMSELRQAFSGVALTFAPTERFQQGGRRPGLVAAVRPRMVGTGAALLFALLTGFALLVPSTVVPSFVRVFVDSVLVRNLGHWLQPLLLIMLAAALVQAALVWLQQHYLLRLETQLALKGSADFLWHVLRLPYGFFVQRYAGDVSTRAQASDRVAKLLSSDLSGMVLDALLVVFYAVLMAQYDLVLTGLGVATAALNLLLLRWTSRIRGEVSQQIQQERGKLSGISMAGLQSIETLKAGAAESDFFARWAGQLTKFLNANQRLAVMVMALTPVPALLTAINFAVFLGIGGMRVMDGELTIGMLLALQALMMAFFAPLSRVLAVAGQVNEVESGLKRLDDVLQAPLDPHAPVAADYATAHDGPLQKLTGRIELRGVTFGYSRLDPPLVSDFSLTVEPGARVALVGKSGSGKSTVAKLVSGLLQPWEGEIRFDGRERLDVPRPVISGSLAVVEQDVFLFEGTVRDNLTMWDASVETEDVVAAARDAAMLEELTARPGGLQGQVEEGGRNFSGGQRQRLEIARALVPRPTMLVLDEATSALDPATEMRIDQSLRARGCTCLIVAHRLSTIRDCDEIIVMDRGRIVQRGPHEVLRMQPGLYRDLIDSE